MPVWLLVTVSALHLALPGVPPSATASFSAGLLSVDSPVGKLSVFHCLVPSDNPAAPLLM